jgi:hypothetical protein
VATFSVTSQRLLLCGKVYIVITEVTSVTEIHRAILEVTTVRLIWYHQRAKYREIKSNGANMELTTLK